VPCEDIEIRGCRAIKCRGSGVTVGSETSASIRNIWMHDCTLEQVASGFNLKTMKGRGGVVENIDIENIEVVHAVRDAIRINMRHTGEPLDDLSQPEINIPVVRNVHVENLRCRKTPRAMTLRGIEGYEPQNVRICNSTICADKGPSIEHVQASMENVTILQNGAEQ